ncbi:squamosa promoter-binding-like protein 6 [Salvia divinorum]|uniref:Squamosa promoter-binding-like protein 6 n=1 Tax=Salvia divinorum TaxID=28513 RepID=A0ABD1IIK8_SALDI
MEFMSCAFEGRALLCGDDTDFGVDGLTRSRNLLQKWDGEDEVDSIGIIEPLLPDTMSKPFIGDQCLDSNGDHYSGKPVQEITVNTLMEFGTRFPSSASKAKDEKSSPESSVSAKRAKLTNLQSLVPTCQVFGCNKDLSSSKDYHKRHRVCDLHSKTAAVIVNGIRQRFCQQCSRFHLLAEFDEGKRSCRKRLAGHNERRRKPQFNAPLGSTYFTGDASNSFIFSRILPGGLFGVQCEDRHLKVQDEPRQTSQLALDVKLSQSVLCFHGMGKQYPKKCLNAPSPLPEMNSSSDSGFALSLLSAREHTLSMSMPQNSTTALGESSSKNVTQVIYSSNGDGVTIGTEIQPEPYNLKPTNPLSHQSANTVSLLELSLHLQRVEQQKYYGQIKMENDIFCDSTIA